jgi:hypothetical protein
MSFVCNDLWELGLDGCIWGETWQASGQDTDLVGLGKKNRRQQRPEADPFQG